MQHVSGSSYAPLEDARHVTHVTHVTHVALEACCQLTQKDARHVTHVALEACCQLTQKGSTAERHMCSLPCRVTVYARFCDLRLGWWMLHYIG
jgi:hypothetical protein